MLETLLAAETTTNKVASFSALFAFVPRQVTLANSKQQSMKNNNKDSSETLENGKTPTVESIKKDKTKKKKKNKCKDPLPLHLSIAAYLQHKGFTQTLAAFQTEAPIAELDDTKPHALDLDMYYKYLETSNCDAKSNNNVSEELDVPNDGVTTEVQEENKCVVPEEPKIKKKKKRSNKGDVGKVDEQPGDSNEFTKSANDSDDKSTKSQGKENKIKLGSESFDGFSRDIGSETIPAAIDKIVPESQLDESDRKSQDKKKKKSKLILVENGGSEACSLEGKSAVDISSEILLDEKKLKSKGKKEKKISSECLRDLGTEEFDQVDFGKNASKKEISEDNTVSIDKKSSKKRKKMASEGIESQPEDNTVNIDKNGSKKRKKMSSEGHESQIEGDGRQTIEVSQKKEKANDLLESDGHAGKKRKTENGQVDHKKSQEISLEMKLDALPEGEKTPKGSDTTDLHANGNLEKNGREGSAPSKSTKKQQKGSAEPKTVNAFQRVKIDEVEFADDRLQDNSYWAKGGSDSGYGAKAQEVLGQVRGRDFRHEKTKKKRGSYRGGQIDLQTHSIKFNYSDEE